MNYIKYLLTLVIDYELHKILLNPGQWLNSIKYLLTLVIVYELHKILVDTGQ